MVQFDHQFDQYREAQKLTTSKECILQCYGGCGRTWVAEASEAHSAGGIYGALCGDCSSKARAESFVNICPALYRDTDIARLPQEQFNRATAWKQGPRGLILVGATGKCKSRIAWKLIERVLTTDKHCPSFIWFDCVSFGHELVKHYRSDDAEDWLSRVASVDLVFFDDLGKLKLTERAETEIFGIVERRCAKKLPIIATTNDDGDSLAARMTENRGPALIRRLREFCEIVSFQ